VRSVQHIEVIVRPFGAVRFAGARRSQLRQRRSANRPSVHVEAGAMRDYGGMSWPVSARVLVWLTEPRRGQGCWPRFVRVPAAPLAALPCWCRARIGTGYRGRRDHTADRALPVRSGLIREPAAKRRPCQPDVAPCAEQKRSGRRPYSVHARATDRASRRRSRSRSPLLARSPWHHPRAPGPPRPDSDGRPTPHGLRLGIHARGPGPGDTASLPYFTVADLATTLERVDELGGSIIHPGDRWAVCRDSEGSPFALAAAPAAGD
jgi:hypothetical protein